MEHITHDNYDRNGDGRGRTVLQNLTGYINDHMRECHNKVKRRIQEASEDIEQIAVKSKAELEMRIMELEKRLKESETHRDRYRNERNDLRKILINFSKERQQKISNDKEVEFKREIANFENTHEQKEKDWAKELKDLVETSDDMIREQKQKIEEMKKPTEMKDMEIQRLQEQGKAMGDKLTDTNPNIDDLSDKDRPSKLAERYAELYDNQWTDAYDNIKCYLGNEEEVIRTLLETLMDVMKFCTSQAKLQLEKLHRTFTFSKQEGDNIHDNVTKQLKDVRRALSTTATQNLYQEYIDHLRKSRDKTLKHAMEIKPFVKECFEICWSMAIQDPPIVLSQIPLKGVVLETEMYRPYTRTGRLIQFVVWPALLLHESGPILVKGVAQGKSDCLDRSTEAFDTETIVPTSSAGTRAYARELSSKVEMSPTREEMKIYFHYVDRREYSKAIDRLGYKVYMKCQQREHKRSLYC